MFICYNSIPKTVSGCTLIYTEELEREEYLQQMLLRQCSKCLNSSCLNTTDFIGNSHIADCILVTIITALKFQITENPKMIQADLTFNLIRLLR